MADTSREIPSTIAASFKSWWRTGAQAALESEKRLLSRLPYYGLDDHPSGVVASSSQIQISNSQQINTLTFTPRSEAISKTDPVVLLHGYGAGLGFFYRNFPALGSWAASRRTPVYALDWLGMGRSSRPPFRIHAKREDTAGRVHEAESFFIDALEEWRQEMRMEKMTLIGHSLGGYLSVAYALRFPNRVGKIILLSPAGVPSDPNTSEAPARELDPTPTEPTGSGKSTALGGSKERASSIHSEQAKQKRQESRSRRLFTYLWEEGWSPFQVVRSSLMFAPLLVGKYSTRRFTGLTEQETQDMHEYILNITLAKGSGEYSISHLLAPGATARMPLVNRVAALSIPITFVYGDHDWMDPMGGYEAVENLKKAGNKSSKMVVIPNAGHHVYLDNPKAVNDLICKELDKTVV